MIKLLAASWVGMIGTIAPCLAIATFLASGPGLAGEPASGMSGQYGPLTVIVSGNDVFGTFFDERGEPDSSGIPPFSCIFLMKGSMHGDTAKVVTWAPGNKDVIPGELTFDGDQLALKLDADQAGCDVDGDLMVDAPEPLPATGADRDWIGVGMVSVDRAYLRRQAGSSAAHRPYLITFDPVVILHRVAGWVQVTYLGGETPVTGWLRQSDLVSENPPRTR